MTRSGLRLRCNLTPAKRLIISAEGRRNMIIRELRAHREGVLARKARSEIIDAEPAHPRDRQRLTVQSDDERAQA